MKRFDGNLVTVVRGWSVDKKNREYRYHLLKAEQYSTCFQAGTHSLPRYTVPKLPLPSCLIVTRSSPIVLSDSIIWFVLDLSKLSDMELVTSFWQRFFGDSTDPDLGETMWCLL